MNGIPIIIDSKIVFSVQKIIKQMVERMKYAMYDAIV
jgi:hypothetical protein